jgi:hypothetical protein
MPIEEACQTLINPPDSNALREGVAAFVEANDNEFRFLIETFPNGGQCQASEIYQNYKTWAKEDRCKTKGVKSFFVSLKKLGCHQSRQSEGSYYKIPGAKTIERNACWDTLRKGSPPTPAHEENAIAKISPPPSPIGEENAIAEVYPEVTPVVEENAIAQISPPPSPIGEENAIAQDPSPLIKANALEISFGTLTTKVIAGEKTVTRRDWSADYARKFILAYQGGYPIKVKGTDRRIKLISQPWKSTLHNISDAQMKLEGCEGLTIEEFRFKYFPSLPIDNEVWVIEFKLLPAKKKEPIDDYPHLTSMGREAKEKQANKIKNLLLEAGSKEQLASIKNEWGERCKWVWRNWLNPAEKSQIEVIANQLSLLDLRHSQISITNETELRIGDRVQIKKAVNDLGGNYPMGVTLMIKDLQVFDNSRIEALCITSTNKFPDTWLPISFLKKVF